MGKRYVKNVQKTNKHGIPIGLKDIEEIVDEAERKEQKQELKVEETKKEYKRKEFLETIIVKPDPNYRKEFKENKARREEAEEIEAKKRMELLKVIEKMRNNEER